MYYSGSDYMVYKRGKFVIHYRDGTTYMEDKKDHNAWLNRPKKSIKALAIYPEHSILATKILSDNKKVRAIIELKKDIQLDPIILRGSDKYEYGWFMDKHYESIPNPGTYGIRIGMIVDPEGHCVCVEYVGNGMPRMYYTTVHSLHMDQNSLTHNYNIDLKECGKEIGNH